MSNFFDQHSNCMYIWNYNVLSSHPFAMLYQSQIASHCTCNAVWEGFERFTLVSIQSCFDTNGSRFQYTSKVDSTHWNQYKLKSFRSKSELGEISQWKSFHVRIANESYWSKEWHPRRRKIMFVWRSRNFFRLPDSMGSQTSLTVEQIVQYCLPILSMEIL